MNINRVELLGRVRFDPKYNENLGISRFALQTIKQVKSKDGEDKEYKSFHNIIAWGNMAKQVNQCIIGGANVLIIGELKTTTYMVEGFKKTMTEVHIEKFSLCQ